MLTNPASKKAVFGLPSPTNQARIPFKIGEHSSNEPARSRRLAGSPRGKPWQTVRLASDYDLSVPSRSGKSVAAAKLQRPVDASLTIARGLSQRASRSLSLSRYPTNVLTKARKSAQTLFGRRPT
jgi:hypothetical protein